MYTLPSVSGKNLLRQKMVFPRDFAGALNLVFIAFQQWQQRQVDSWVPLAEQLTAQFPHLAYYEFPVIDPLNPVSRLFINEGMRAGIPDPATRSRTVTLYLEKRPFCAALGIPDEADIEVILFDRAGQLLWRTRGECTIMLGSALTAALVSHTAVDVDRDREASMYDKR